MQKKHALFVAIFITVFLLVIAGGVATSALADNQAPSTAQISAADAVKTYQAREAQYQALLAQANQELVAANQKITELAGQVSTTSATSSTPEASYPVSAETAMSIAFQVARDYPLSVPDLVSFNGVAAYEVKFQAGTIYVDATSGQILYNGIQAAPQVITSDDAVRIAVQYLGNPNVTGITVGSYNGSQVYIVVFANGQKVYVDQSGQILAVQMPSNSSSTSHESESEHESSGDD